MQKMPDADALDATAPLHTTQTGLLQTSNITQNRSSIEQADTIMLSRSIRKKSQKFPFHIFDTMLQPKTSAQERKWWFNVEKS